MTSKETSTTNAQTTTSAVKIDAKPPRLEQNLVHEFVLEAHGNLDKVKALLEMQATLVNATWDWGGGDWETALGGAAHMGRKDIALYLLSKGARMDMFAAAMLGELEIVRAAIDALPDTRSVLGPHGIPLIAHARAGGEEAKAVFEFLRTLE